MNELRHKDFIYNINWGNTYISTLYTFESECKNDDVATKVMWLKNSVNTRCLAFACQHAAVLCADKGHKERQQAIRDSAIGISDGEEVLIEGIVYRVIVLKNGHRYSNGIQFEPVKRWVHGNRDGKWHLVGTDDRDYEKGVPQQEMLLRRLNNPESL